MNLIIPNSKNADYFEIYFRGYMPHKIWVSRPNGEGADFPADDINDVLYDAIKKYFDKNMWGLSYGWEENTFIFQRFFYGRFEW